MRTIPAGQTAGIAASNRKTSAKLLLENPDGAMVDMGNLEGVNWLDGVEISESADQPIKGAVLSLKREVGALSLSPFMEGSEINRDGADDFAPFINPGRRFEVQIATMEAGDTPASEDWAVFARGKLDTPNIGLPQISISARDYGAVLNDRSIIEADEINYGDVEAEWPTLEEVAEEIANEVLDEGEFDLKVVGDPDFAIPKRVQSPGSLLEALMALFSLIGWDFRYLWDDEEEEFLPTLYEPARESTASLHTFGPGDYYVIPSLTLDQTGIRNVCIVMYTDGAGAEQSVRVEREASIDEFGELVMVLDERDGPIQNEAQAEALAEAALSDTNAPPVALEVEMPIFWPAEIGDIYTFSANGKHFDTDQKYALFAYTHRLFGDQRRTVMQLRGKPSGGYLRWLDRETDGVIDEPATADPRAISVLSSAWEIIGASESFPAGLWAVYRMSLAPGADVRSMHVQYRDVRDPDDPGVWLEYDYDISEHELHTLRNYEFPDEPGNFTVESSLEIWITPYTAVDGAAGAGAAGPVVKLYTGVARDALSGTAVESAGELFTSDVLMLASRSLTAAIDPDTGRTKIGQDFDVGLFAADLTGATLSDDEVNAAIQAASDAGGGKVRIPGIVKVNKLLMKTGVSLVGDGWGASIVQEANAHTESDAGTSSGSNTVNTLNDATKAWDDDEHYLRTLRITSGPLAGEARVIIANTATQLTIGMESGTGNENWSEAPGAVTYEILQGLPIVTSASDADTAWHIENLVLDGNKANQVAFNPGILVTNDYGASGGDNYQVVRDVKVKNVSGWGVLIGQTTSPPDPPGSGPRECLFDNVVVQDAGRHSKFTWSGGGTDCKYVNFVSSGSGLAGCVWNGAADRIISAKAFGAGQREIENQGSGHLITQPTHALLLYGQENWEHGVHCIGLVDSDIHAVVDANRLDGLHLFKCTDSMFYVQAAPGGPTLLYTQRWGVSCTGQDPEGSDNSERCLIELNAAPDHTFGAIDPALEGYDNDIRANNRRKGRVYSSWGSILGGTTEHFTFDRGNVVSEESPAFSFVLEEDPIAGGFESQDGAETKRYFQYEHRVSGIGARLRLGNATQEVDVNVSSALVFGTPNSDDPRAKGLLDGEAAFEEGKWLRWEKTSSDTLKRILGFGGGAVLVDGDAVGTLFGAGIEVPGTVVVVTANEALRWGKSGMGASGNPYYTLKHDNGGSPKAAVAGWDGTTARTFAEFDFDGNALSLMPGGGATVIGGSATVGTTDTLSRLNIQRYDPTVPYAIITAGAADENIPVGLLLQTRDATGALVDALTITGPGTATFSGNTVVAGTLGVTGAVALTVPLGVASGGTGLATYTAAGRVLYSTGATTTAALALGTARQVFQVNAGATAPEWTSNLDLPGTLDVTGAAVFDAAGTFAGTLTASGAAAVGRAALAWGGSFAGHALDVLGLSIAGTSATDGRFFQNAYFDGSNYVAVATGAAAILQLGGGELTLYTAPSVSAGATLTLTARLTIANTGAVTLAGLVSAPTFAATSGAFTSTTSNEAFRWQKSGGGSSGNPYYVLKHDNASSPVASAQSWDGTTARAFIQMDHGNARLTLGPSAGRIDAIANLCFNADATYDIGSPDSGSTSLRPRDIRLSRDVISGGGFYGIIAQITTTDEAYRWGKSGMGASGNPYYAIKHDNASSPVGFVASWDGSTARTYMKFDHGNNRLYLGASGMAVGFFGSGGSGQLTPTGSRGGNAALASLLTQLASYGLIIDGTSA